MSSSKQEFVDRARVATAGTPYAVSERPYGFDLTIDLADARWLTVTRAHGLQRVFTHEVHLKDDGRYGITDVDHTVTYGAGGASLSAGRSFKRGRVMSYSRRVEIGLDAKTGQVGKVVDYSFRAGEGRELIRRVAKELGWTEKMNGEQLGALWFAGVVVVLMVVAFGAVGIHALLT